MQILETLILLVVCSKRRVHVWFLLFQVKVVNYSIHEVYDAKKNSVTLADFINSSLSQTYTYAEQKKTQKCSVFIFA